MNLTWLSPLANHLWQSTVFAAIALLLNWTLRRNRARVRHAVWLAASCKFLLPASLLIALGGQVRWQPTPATPPFHVPVAIEQVSQPFPDSVVFAPIGAEPPLPAANPLPAILFAIWACGFVGCAVSWAVRWRRIRIAVRAGTPFDLELPVRAVVSPALWEPGVFGIFRPVLLLPEGVSHHLTPSQLRAVVAHELSHVRHRDNLSAAIHMLVETVFWFHPLVWWIGKRMVAEREQACDEEVLRLGGEPREYAQGILKICKLYVESPLVCVSGVTGANLTRRIEAILTHRRAPRLSRTQMALLASVAAAALAAPLILGIGRAHPQDAQPAPSTPSVAFEVASVKVATEPVNELKFCVVPCAPGERLSIVGSRVDIRYMSLYNLLVTAYRIKPHQLSGPEWMRSQRFDIEARMPAGVSKDRLPEMLQALLLERFNLSVHRDREERPAYALVEGKSGPKLTPSAADADAPPPDAPGSRPLPTPQGEGRQLADGTMVITGSPYGTMRIGRGPSGMRFEFKSLTMPALADLLTPHLDRPVVDMTNLKGTYALTSDNHPPSSGGASKKGESADVGQSVDTGRPPDPFGEGLFTAIGKAGLKLTPSKAPVEILVVDHLEKTPTAN